MKNKKLTRLLRCAPLAALSAVLLALPARAEEAAGGDIAGAINGIWTNASGQMKTICNDVVFPALSWVCAIGFVISVIIAIVSYKKHHTVEVGWPIALLVGLIVSLTASTWVWTLIGT